MTTTETAPAPTPTQPPPLEARRDEFRAAFRALRGTFVTIGALLLIGIVVVAVAYVRNRSPAPAGDVQATTVDFKITMPTTLTAGAHTIGLTNDGTVGHELVLFKTDLPANALPLQANGDVNEASSELVNVGDSGEPLKAGGTESFDTKSLNPGHYVAVCNLPGHYQLGMKLNVTVK